MTLVSAEAVLLSSIFNNPEGLNKALSYGVSGYHFRGYREEYNWLLTYLATYGEEPSRDIFSAAFPEFCFSEHVEMRSAADLVFKAYNKSRITEAMTEATDLMTMGDVREAYNTLVSATPLTAAPKPRRLLTDSAFLDDWDAALDYVEVPYQSLQRATGGIRPGNLWYLAARPGQGKTAHLCNIAKKALLDGNRVLFYSLEMSEMEVRARFHAALAQHYSKAHPEWAVITVQEIRDRRVDAHLYKTFVGELADRLSETGGSLDIHTPKDGVCTPAVIAGRADEYHLNLVDYIGLMKSDSGSASVEDWRIAAQISNALKDIALSNATAVLAAAQINREGEIGKNPPKVVNMAQSDALGQDGDVVVTMRGMSRNVATHFALEKNRHGAGGFHFYTAFKPNIGEFTEITQERAETLSIEAESEVA